MGKQQGEQQAGQSLSLDQRLAAAREKARAARAHLDGLNAQLAGAVAEQRDDDAEQARALIPDASHAWGEAEAEARAIEGVLEDLAREQQQREAAEQAERRRQAAARHLETASERARQHTDELQALRAEVIAGVEAIRAALQHGYWLETQVRQDLTTKEQARVELGETTGIPVIIGPGTISALVDSSPALAAIHHGMALPR